MRDGGQALCPQKCLLAPAVLADPDQLARGSSQLGRGQDSNLDVLELGGDHIGSAQEGVEVGHGLRHLAAR